MKIIGNTNITVGEPANLSCLTDLRVQRLEWTLNDAVVARSNGQQVNLMFTQVVDHLHNRVYVCRATTPYGTFEKAIMISVHSRHQYISHGNCILAM